ncbi:hybrid sensor histidine kinase/response regulator [Marinobacter sp. HL-58]|uniref:hybrid sensor histidine kinase/response regulator n=1 Tax=Marinobacter sp. HL-58 TaxID=1479237 RepID=UPI000691B072|nr:hybrid sensor histidine kinase/response regulator [Marinobacter sp. HL-58]KPQ02902.1 MAG: two component signal transduction system histidine kinase [Marinobacter sp. HL-58]
MKSAQLRAQGSSGFRTLRFEPELEQRYRQIRNQGIRERARPVSAAALLLFLVYAFLDALMLPPSVARETIAVRLLITCPVIAGVWWLSWRNISHHTFVRLYCLAYLTGGLSVVAIIGIARVADHPLPYEGILLMLMFGYFVMGLPFGSVSILSTAVIAAYLAVESVTGMDTRQLVTNGFFIVTANIIGMVGSWLSEHRQRAHFLDRQMLEASRHQAEQESKRKTRLITIASHDLRQPLNIISLILENLTADGLPESQSRLVSRLKHSVTHFNNLLASVLDISRLQEGMITPQPRELSPLEVIRNIADTCTEQARRQGVQFNTATPTQPAAVIADPQLLHRVLQNLVVNALDHSNASQISLSSAQVGEQMVFEVSDNGKGIDKAKLSQIFDPFYRDSEHDDPGLGLGLAIVRELTGLMDGECDVVSQPGCGARFRVSLPAATAPLTPPISQPAHPGHSSRQHCLVVVEDHHEARYWVCQTLAAWGYRVKAFASAEQAVDQWPDHPDTLLLSDVHLPGLSGHGLFERLQQRHSITGGILMTANTAHPQGYDPQLRLWVLHKPLIPMRLRAAIMHLTHPGGGG